jgi:tetratricopeptide (TPR) repeat protein
MANKEKLIEKAQKYLQKGKLKDAHNAFEKVLQEDPTDVRIILRKGEVEEKLDLLHEAATSYKQVAEKYSADGFYPKAVAIYKKITKIEPENMGIYMKLGSLYQKLGIDNEAKHYFHKVATHYKSKGLKSEYLEVVKMISEFGGEDTGSKVDLAQEYLEQGDQERAIEQFRAASQQIFESANIRELDMLVEKMAKLGIEDLDAQTIQVKTYMEAREPKKALRIIQKIYAAHPKNTEILELLAVCFRELRQPAKALSVYTELEQIYKKDGQIDKAKRVEGSMQELQKKIKGPAVKPENNDESADKEDFFEDQAMADVLQSSAHSSPTALVGQSSDEALAQASEDISLDELEMFDAKEESESTQMGTPPANERPVDTVRPVDIEDLENELNSMEMSEDLSVSAQAPEQKVDASLADVDLSDLDLSDDPSTKDFSGDVSDLSFQSFEKPIESSEISAEEVSGLIHKAGLSDELSAELEGFDAFDASALEEEMMLGKDEQAADKIDFDASPVGEIETVKPVETQWSDQELSLDPTAESPDELTGFDEFTPQAPEKSEISVNEEEFVLIQEAMDESSLDEMSLDDIDQAIEQAPIEDEPDPQATALEYKEGPTTGPRIDIGLDELGIDEDDMALDVSDDQAFDLSDGGQLETDEPQELEAPPAPNPKRTKTDLDSVAFEMEKSFPEVELDEDQSLNVENMSDSEFFDLSEALRDEIQAIESDDMPDDFEEQHLSPEEVIMEFKKGVARTIDKSDSQTYYNLGVAYKEMGLLDEAIGAFETAQANDPQQIEAGSMIGLCKMQQGQYEEALGIFGQLLEHDAIEDQIRHGLMYDQALCFEQLGQTQKAHALMKEISKQNPQYRDAAEQAQKLGKNSGAGDSENADYSGKIIVNLKDRKKNQ